MKRRTSMLEYCKIILVKVSFSHELFKKELRKSSYLLQEDEMDQLYAWCKKRFGMTIIS